MTNPLDTSTTFVELLRRRAQQQPDQLAYTFLLDGESEELSLTYGELDLCVRAIAAQLQHLAAPGERVLLLYTPGLDYIAAFFACLYAGLVAVPTYPPNPARIERTVAKLQSIVEVAQPAVALTSAAFLPLAESLAAASPPFRHLTWLATDLVDLSQATGWQAPAISSETVAFLQFTSGSTATPKGVVLSHANLLHNSTLIQQAFGHTSESQGLIWLPPYHDMGLIGGILQPLYVGFPVTLMTPLAFAQRPLRWLQAISRYRASTSGGPNFAYELCVQKLSPEECATLDLSSWKVAFNGAEPINHATFERFAEKFAPYGFRQEAFYPCYGLAEATLLVSGGLLAEPPVVRSFDRALLEHNRVVEKPTSDADTLALVGCGPALPGQQLALVEPDSLTPCAADEVGEIWLRGPSVAQGYWNQPAETDLAFRAQLPGGDAGTWLRTGDLGFVHQGELFISGRLKDLIIIRGRNLYPHDIELTVGQCHPALSGGGGAAFTVDVDGQERLVVLHELRRHQHGDLEAVYAAIRQAVAEQHDVQVYAIELLKARSILRTTSGKVQRRACRARFLANGFDALGRSILGAEVNSVTADVGMPDPPAEPPPDLRRRQLEEELTAQLAQLLRTTLTPADAQRPLTALGLDSLAAIELQHRIETELGLIIGIDRLLEGVSIAELAAEVLNAEARQDGRLVEDAPTSTDTLPQAVSPLSVASTDTTSPTDFPLSAGQRALYFLQRLAPESAAYHIASAVRIAGALDRAALHRAIERLAERHPALRTTFTLLRDQPVQQLHQLPISAFREQDTAAWSAERFEEHLLEEVHRPFDLALGPLLRISLFSRSEHEHVLLLVVHHIIADLWSMTVLMHDLSRLYSAERQAVPAALAPLEIGYVDYVRQQQRMLAGPEGERLWAYWQAQLAGSSFVLSLPTDRPRPSLQSYRGSSFRFQLSPELSLGLKALAEAHGATLYMTLLAAFQVLLYRYSGQDDLLVGSPSAGRNRAHLAPVVGYFVNPLVLRARLAGKPTFAAFLNQVRQTVLAAFAHQDEPFATLVERLQPERDGSRSPLFQVMFSFQKTYLRDNAEALALALGQPGTPAQVGEWLLEAVALEQQTAQFDLTLTFGEVGQQLVAALQYNTDLFTAASMSRLAGHLQTLLEAVVAQPEQRIVALPLLTAEEQRELLHWNATQAEYRAEAGMHTLFEQQAARTPDADALVCGQQRLSYHELEGRANQLAHYLQQQGVRPGERVGICLERLDMVVGLLGILKAGAAYVPLDPAYPPERLAFILQDAQLSLVLTQQRWLSALAAGDKQCICLDTDWDVIARQPAEQPSVRVSAEHPIYCIYTSGSTGRPKGAAVYHRGFVNLVEWYIREFQLVADDKILLISSLNFDLTQKNIFAPLVLGATLHLSEAGPYDPQSIVRTVGEAGITLLNCTPSAFYPLLKYSEPATLAQLATLRYVFLGGEPISVARLWKWISAASFGAEIVNTYGPTECSDVSSFYRLRRPWQYLEAAVPIGWPIANTQLYVLDERMEPVPVGVVGELCIAGDGVGMGYTNDAALTAEKFVPNPFVQGPGARGQGSGPDPRSPIPDPRLYRTGDLARRRADGALEFVGRIDHQVKVRGFRVELGEIELALHQHPRVRTAAVAVRQDAEGEQQLVAYLVPKEAGAPSRAELLAFLKQRLPSSMLPSALVWLAELPLTPSGKVDYRALPEPHEPAEEPEHRRVVPQTRIGQTITALWRELLQLDQVSAHENFFDLGGHSLLVVEMQSRLKSELGVELQITDLFQYTTISTLTEYVEQQLDVAPDRQPADDYVLAPVPNQLPRPSENAVAIIGLDGRFPKANTIEAFWQNLCEGVEGITFFSEDELLAAGVSRAELQDPNYVRAKAVLDDIELFDPAFFGYNPREAELLDPQQRLFLECSWSALERAGYDTETYAGRIGLYAGTHISTYLFDVYSSGAMADPVGAFLATISNDKDYLTTRTSYKLNLTGPSVTVQTACSTSLVAVHLACQALLRGECEMALAGAVTIHVPQLRGYSYQEGGTASPDGHCRAFDAQAQGTVFGSGVGVVLLKPLGAALSDGDTIHAVIKGSAINNDGAAKAGYTAPSVAGQAQVISEALRQAQVAPETVGLVETHGTGTPLGDPIELSALAQVFPASAPQCALGAVKTTIGHLDAAAGIAGLIKAVLSLQHGQIPPNLHFTRPNPQLPLEATSFYIPTSLTPWPVPAEHPRRAGVSSFGIGGTNAHVILEQAPPQPVPPAAPPWQLLLLSAKSESALEQMSENLVAYLETAAAAELAEVAYTLQVGRRAFAQRRVLVCRDPLQAAAALRQPSHPPVRSADTSSLARPNVVFLFPGQGSQVLGMGQALYQQMPLFRQHVDRCAEMLQPHLGLDIRQVIFADHRPPTTDPSTTLRAGHRPPTAEDRGLKIEDSRADASEKLSSILYPLSSELDRTQYTQPALFVVEYALAQLWMSWGVVPQAMLGHSLGEYVAACLAGVFSLHDALQLVVLRGQLMEAAEQGRMLAVEQGAEALQPYLGEGIELAAVNGPTQSVLGGAEAAVEALEARLAAAGVQTRRLGATRAFHTSAMTAAAEALTAAAAKMQLQPPRRPFISNVTGDWISAAEATDPAYWGRQACAPVAFAAGVAQVQELLGAPVWLEVGPGQTLSRLVRRTATDSSATTVACLAAAGTAEEAAQLLEALGQLWLAGARINWSQVAGEGRRRVPLPTYPFERQRVWIEPAQAAQNGKLHSTSPTNGAPSQLYMPFWKPSPLPSTHSNPVATWLLFVDEAGLGQEIAGQLTGSGSTIIRVVPDSQFRHIEHDLYAINPQRPEDYATLLDTLSSRNTLPQQLIYLWSFTPGTDCGCETTSSEQSLTLHYHSLIFLAQALGRQASDATFHISVVSNDMQPVNGQERLNPEKALVLGPCRVINQEYSNITCTSIDLSISQREARATKRIAEQIIVEATSDRKESVIAYRGAYRWTAVVEPLQRADTTTRPPPLRKGGVYLIVGGLGGLGLEFARYLAQTVQARLVLLGRSALPRRADWEALLLAEPHSQVAHRIKAIQQLESLGSEVLLLSADVTDLEQMRAAVSRIYERFEALHGVIHAGGVADGSMIQVQSVEQASLVLNVKVKGVQVLDTLLGEAQLDFLVLCSSLASLLGGPGQSAYCAANAFVDAYAHHKSAGSTPTIALNWDRWQQVGMAARMQVPANLKDWHAEHLKGGLTIEEGLDAFNQALHRSIPQLIVSKADIQSQIQQKPSLPAAIRLNGTDSEHRARSAHSRPKLRSEYVAPRNEVEQGIAVIWQEILGIGQIGVYDDFFELGGHSLLATQLITRLRQRFQLEIPLDALFTSQTVAGLAEQIAVLGHYSQEEIEQLEQLLDQLEQLSDDQVQQLRDGVSS